MAQQQLIEGAYPLRPKENSDEVIRNVVSDLMLDVVQWLEDDYAADQHDAISSELFDLLKDQWDWDGFRLARVLSDAGWECNSALVDILERAHHVRYVIFQKALEKWVSDYDIKPPFPKGTSVTFSANDGKHVGEIVKIYDKRAEYSVFVPALGHIREGEGKTGRLGRIVPYEKVQASGGTNGGPDEPSSF